MAGMFWVLHRRPLKQTWPLFFLLVYVIYPEPDPQTAVFALLFVIIIYLFQLEQPFKLVVPLLATAVLFTILYIATLSPGVLPADNGEFQIVAANLGVAHPPGFALYTLLAHLMTRLPDLDSAAYKVNLFSVLTSVLTLLLVYLTTYRLTNKHGAAVTAVLALATATTFWAQATTANIRSLTGLFAAAMIYALVRFREECRGEGVKGCGGEESPLHPFTLSPLHKKDRWLTFFAAILSFGVVHHASLVFMGLVCLIFVVVIAPRLLRTPQRWLRPFLAGLLGLLPLLYFPLRAAANVRGASAGLATIAGFINHVLALGFRGDLFYYLTPAELWPRFQVMANVLTFQFHPLLLAGMALGFILLLWHDRQMALLLGGTFALHAFITATYRAPQTVEYMLPAYVPLVIGLGYGVGKAAEWQNGKVAAVLGALMVVTAVYQGWQRYPSFEMLHHDISAIDYAQNILTQAPPDSIVLADWHWVTPLWYLQEVDHQRPDVNVQFVYPEGESYAANWVARIGEELGNGRAVIATHFDENAYAALPAPEPLGDAYLFRQQPLTTLPADFIPLDLSLNDQIQILGYKLDAAAVEIAQETAVTIAWKLITNNQQPIPLFMHLIGYDGQLYAQDDVPARPQAGITLTQFRLTPRLGAAPGDFAVMLGTPGDGDNRLTLTNLTVTAMSRPPYTQNHVSRSLPDGRHLVGFDWDNTLNGRPRLYLHWQTEQGYQTEVRDDIGPDGFILPDYFGPWGMIRNNQQLTVNSQQFYVPLGQGIVWTGNPINQRPVTGNQQLTLRQTFHSSRPILHDLVVSVRLIGYEADGFHWAWWDLADWIPALGTIPTLKWIGGTAVNSIHTVQVNPATQPGQTIGVTLRLYDAFTNRPLPILDERITNELQLPWVPLGQTTAAR
ncbi:MAG: DUF2723 domain-containing protein [Ardenticatenaceae bacterium]|nr:DUF2723 domain-containing protein [Ardenticatenaceae bacterium]